MSGYIQQPFQSQQQQQYGANQINSSYRKDNTQFPQQSGSRSQLKENASNSNLLPKMQPTFEGVAQHNINYLKNSFQEGSSRYMTSKARNISPEKLIKRLEADTSDIQRLSIEDINRELDRNMNEIIVMLNRRKALITHKKKLMRQSFFEEFDQLKKNNLNELKNSLLREEEYVDPQLQQVIEHSNNAQALPPTIVQDIQSGFSGQTGRNEMKHSQDFWNLNKNFEGEVDSLLKRLKHYDQELEKSNLDIQQICQKLDTVEDTIKAMLLQKSDEQLQKAEPHFNQKNQLHNQLKTLVNNRNKLKDEKIELIYKILQALQNLKGLRDKRLRELMNVFGIQQSIQVEEPEAQSKINQYIDFVDQLENLAKIRENLQELEREEDPILQDIERVQGENDIIFSELVKKQSEEAKFFAQYQENLKRRITNHKTVQLFMNQSNLQSVAHLDIQDILQRFKDNILFLKPLVEEDQAIRLGLQKTNETINTFDNILRASENEKERRAELITILEDCQKLKDLEERKIEDQRKIEFDIQKKQNQKKNMEEDLENIISDVDLDQYKKLGALLKQRETELRQVLSQSQRVQQEVKELQSEAVKKMDIIKDEYDDIIREFLPNNLMNTYDFNRAGDFKSVKNQLKKAFKRLLGENYAQQNQFESYM
ncbi:hypothetical protein PPERSA_01821 [Pseudocohnilembus persalinus]|uniref:Uncharacterized protein n=1 Tax=Pseudocohnilembus persalinus TaxID=266149 RepID=A0A0V0QL42_PSEPJ|nr:hypothetical protein PPERSA_01821 [Pseudocohnilembus persalinus]|eukprot:KRX02704.1 hypothetical protein PPERSA_01821 [Pseudocohnilembus persalinus]